MPLSVNIKTIILSMTRTVVQEDKLKQEKLHFEHFFFRFYRLLEKKMLIFQKIRKLQNLLHGNKLRDQLY